MTWHGSEILFLPVSCFGRFQSLQRKKSVQSWSDHVRVTNGIVPVCTTCRHITEIWFIQDSTSDTHFFLKMWGFPITMAILVFYHATVHYIVTARVLIADYPAMSMFIECWQKIQMQTSWVGRSAKGSLADENDPWSSWSPTSVWLALTQGEKRSLRQTLFYSASTPSMSSRSMCLFQERI